MLRKGAWTILIRTTLMYGLITACSSEISEKSAPVKARTAESKESLIAASGSSENAVEDVVPSAAAGPDSRISTADIENTPEEGIFVMPENSDVEVEFSEPILVTGAHLATTNETGQCENRDLYQDSIPVFSDLPKVPGEYIFCMRISKNDIVVGFRKTPPVVVFSHESDGQSHDSPAKSCREVLAMDPDAVDGLYWLNPADKEPFQAFCDMSTAGGGWTLVVAQFESDELTDWGEGVQSDYDPALTSGRSFALSDEQIPSHTESSFGKGLDSDFAGSAVFVYHTGDIPLTEVRGNDGQQYQIHRNKDYYYHWHNPEEARREVAAWQNALTFDLKEGRHYSWSYSPMVKDERGRGLGMLGNQRYISDSYAWTVWVR